MNVAVVYITTTNVKWQTHLCNFTSSFGGIDKTKLFKKLITESIDYLLNGKNEANNFYEEYNEILEKKYDIELKVYGSEEKEKYQYNMDNLITFFINSEIKILEKYDSFLKSINESKGQIDPLVYGMNELIDLIDQTDQYYYSDLNGFKGEEKIKKINKIYNDFHYIFIVNTLLSIIIFIVYLMFILHIHNIEIFFLEKLINFNSPNFEAFLNKLNELKKKFRNENNEDEDKEDIENDFDSKMNSKNEEEDEKNENQKDISHKNLKSNKKNKKKDGNKQKQKKNKMKLMTFFFIKENISFGLKILFIIIISLTYYIFSMLIGTNKKKNLLAFDVINEEMIGIFKESFDTYILLKKELVLYEDRLKNCKIDPEKEIYRMNIPLVSEIKTPNLGNNLVTMTGESGFSKKTMDNFTELFSGNACPVLSHSDTGLSMCSILLDGVLKKGMEQTLTKMGTIIGTIIEELNSLNNRGKEFIEIINSSSFSLYESFIEFYYQRAYLVLYEIFVDLRSEKLNSIKKLLRMILIGYIILFNLLVLLFVYLIYYINKEFNSFLNFIWILPVKYLSEDENFYKEVIKFGKDSF
jgi:tetrahydromethanopterin S-methyltransferase subunit B